MSDLDDYDWSEVDARSARRAPTRGRGGAPAVIFAAALWAVDDIVLGERRREPVVEEIDVPGPDLSQRVVVHLVRGDPRRSWARVIAE